MWNLIKKGFGYGFGGRIGWELGGAVWRWVARGIALMVTFAVVQCGGGSVKTYQDYQQSHPQVHQKGVGK